MVPQSFPIKPVFTVHNCDDFEVYRPVTSEQTPSVRVSLGLTLPVTGRRFGQGHLMAPGGTRCLSPHQVIRTRVTSLESRLPSFCPVK